MSGVFLGGGGACDYFSICEWTINLSSHHTHQHTLKSQPGVEQGTIMVSMADLSIKMGSQKRHGSLVTMATAATHQGNTGRPMSPDSAMRFVPVNAFR